MKITFKCPEDLWVKLETEAVQTGKKRAEVIRHILTSYFENRITLTPKEFDAMMKDIHVSKSGMTASFWENDDPEVANIQEKEAFRRMREKRQVEDGKK